MTEVEEDREDRSYWHSEHYRNQIGNGLIGPIWDALMSHPNGVTVPEIVADLVNDDRVRSAQSWFLSFGAEQRHRTDNAEVNKFHQRYRGMDPDSPDSYTWTWDEERRYRYALTERVHWNLTKVMMARGWAVQAGRFPTNDLQNSQLLQIITGVSRGTRWFLPVYMAGEAPLVTGVNPRCECGKVHHTTYKRRWAYHDGLGPDPFILRANLRDEITVALESKRIGNARELLERARDLLTA